MSEEDFVKQPFLKLYAKHKGNTNGIEKTHADESATRDFEKRDFVLRVHVPYKRKHNATMFETICHTTETYYWNKTNTC